MHPCSITPGTLIVALDIGKNVHWFGCYRNDGRLDVLWQRRFTPTHVGKT